MPLRRRDPRTVSLCGSWEAPCTHGRLIASAVILLPDANGAMPQVLAAGPWMIGSLVATVRARIAHARRSRQVCATRAGHRHIV